MTSITHEHLLRVLDYDPSTGIFRWKVGTPKRPKGTVATSVSDTGALVVKVVGVTYQADLLAFFYVNGRWADRGVHLVNGKPTDLRIRNIAENLEQVKPKPGNVPLMLSVISLRLGIKKKVKRVKKVEK